MASVALSRPGELLRDWLRRQVSSDALSWLNDRLGEAAAGDSRGLYLGFGMVPRKIGKDDLQLNQSDLAVAEQTRVGWNPRGWTLDQAARTLLVLALPSPDPSEYVAVLDKLFAAAEMGEAIALYQALPLLPHPAAHRFRCTEGIRTNIKGVFCAVAHRNPYPSEQLDEPAWNQLVLKSLFMGVSLDPIVGLDRRANPALRQMLVDFAHERRAAHRPVPPELWRCVGPFADDAALDDLAATLQGGTPVEQQAAALALAACPLPRAVELLRKRAELSDINAGRVSWRVIASQSSSS